MNIQERIAKACWESDSSDEQVTYRSYSGRAMYGRNCVGIVGTHTQCMAIIASVINEMTQKLMYSAMDITDDSTDKEIHTVHDFNSELQEAVSTLLNFTWDSMGLDVVIYWPRMEYVDTQYYADEEEHDEEDEE